MTVTTTEISPTPPEYITSDYVELISLTLLFIVGGPLNLAACTQLSERPSCTRLDILKKHLNYSDLLVLFIFVPSRVCWLLTYDWRGGDLLCRLVKYFHTFAFQVSSNVIVCIALDRLLSVLSASHHSPEKAHRRTKVMLFVAWITAFLISMPQLVVWRSYLVFEKFKWSQCSQIWEIMRHQNRKNLTEEYLYDLAYEENIYTIVHMSLVFWIPATIVFVSYLIVASWVYLNSKPFSFTIEAVNESTFSRVRSGTKTTAVGSTTDNNRNDFACGVSYNAKQDRIESDLCTSPAVVHFATHPKIVITDDAQNHQSEQRNSSTSGASQPFIVIETPRISRNFRNRAIRISFLLVVAYFVCWLPYNTLGLIQFIDPDFFVNYVHSVYGLHAVIVFNSVINPFLYGLFGNTFRARQRYN